MEKKQLQEMLREMGVAYPSDATRETLMEILKEENHRQWLKSSAARIVRKRRAGAAPTAEEPKPHPPRRPGGKPAASLRKPIQRVGRAPDRHAGRETVAPPAAGPADAPSVTACDLCESTGRELATYPISQKPGARHTAFLCTECLGRVRRLVTDRELKVLKRKARRRADTEVKVDYGTVEHTWGYKPEEQRDRGR